MTEVKVHWVTGSSNVSAVGYSKDLNALVMAYRGGRAYVYYGGKEEHVEQIINAESPGGVASGLPQFKDNFEKINTLMIGWSIERYPFQIGIKPFTIEALSKTLGRGFATLSRDWADKIDLDRIAILLPPNTPDRFYDKVKEWAKDNKIDPNFGVMVSPSGEKTIDNCVGFAILNYTLIFEDPRPQPQPVSKQTPKKARSKPAPESGFAGFFGDNGGDGERQPPSEPQPAPQQLPAAKEDTPIINAGKGKDPKVVVGVPKEATENEWVVALAYAVAAMSKRAGAKLFVDLPNNAPDDMADALEALGVEIYRGDGKLAPSTVAVGIYSD